MSCRRFVNSELESARKLLTPSDPKMRVCKCLADVLFIRFRHIFQQQLKGFDFKFQYLIPKLLYVECMLISRLLACCFQHSDCSSSKTLYAQSVANSLAFYD